MLIQWQEWNGIRITASYLPRQGYKWSLNWDKHSICNWFRLLLKSPLCNSCQNSS